MGTRADFYLGTGKNSKWLGSIAWDGYPQGIPKHILKTKNPDQFESSVKEFISNRDDGTLPEKGWPWPWDDSDTTDYAYCFSLERNKLRVNPGNYPNMAKTKNVTLGRRSGVIVLGGR